MQRIEKDSTDNTKLLHDLIVNMENLGESFKQMKSEVMGWEQEEIPMETDEDRQYQKMQEALLSQVSLSFPHVETTENPGPSTLVSMPVPEAIPVLSDVSTSNLPEGADQRMKDKLDALQQPAVDENPEKIQKDAQFSFDMPTST